MATTKIKNIKSTLKKAIDYIINPEKTEEGKLVYSFGCAVGTADIEMEITAKKGREVGNRLAYHLMQSFAPDDPITPEKALEIGIEYAKQFTQGKYEFVIATHVDQGHIHNHIIFNSTSFVDHKKYQYGIGEKRRMRSISDRMCRENGLSVIQNKSGIRGKGKYEYEQSKNGVSWKDKFRNDIDNAINNAESFDDFILKMEMEDYTVRHNKVISFKNNENGPIRGNRLGEAYTKEAILDRIENKERSIYYRTINNKNSEKESNKEHKKIKSTNINLLVDISKNLKAQQSPGYEHALIRANINSLNRTVNFLIKNKIKTVDDLYAYDKKLENEYQFLRKSYKDLNNNMLGLSEKIKFSQDYKKNKRIYNQSLSNIDKKAFFVEHQDEIISYKAACIYFEKNNISPDTLNINQLFEEYGQVKYEKNQIGKNLKKIRNDLKEFQNVKHNIADTLNIEMDDILKSKNKDDRNKQL